MSSNMTFAEAGGQLKKHQSQIYWMLNLDVTSAIYTASILDKKFGNKYSGGLLDAKVSDK